MLVLIVILIVNMILVIFGKVMVVFGIIDIMLMINMRFVISVMLVIMLNLW